MFKKYFSKVIYIILLALVFATSAGAVDQLPEVMVGQTRVCENGDCEHPSVNKVYYGGFTGNEAVLNFNQSGKEVGKSLAPSASFNGLRNADGNTRSPLVNFGYIDCGSAPSITNTGAFSVSAWVKRTRTQPSPFDPDSWGDNVLRDPPVGQDLIMPKDFIISQGEGMFGDYYLYFNKYDQVVLRTWGYDQNMTGTAGEGIDLYSGNTKIPYNDNNWHHIAVARNTDGVSGHIWIDGVDVTVVVPGTPSPAGHKVYVTSGPVMGKTVKTTIGKLSWRSDPQPPASLGFKENTPYPFKGNISTVRTYARALSLGEIDKLHNETSDVPTDTKLYLKLDDMSSTIKDYSSNNYTGITFYNSSWSEDGPVIAESNNNELLGFEKDLLKNCADNGMLVNPVRCFTLNANSSGVKIMTSRTSVNYVPVTEVAAIMYPSKMIAGDAYDPTNSLNNFAFWGRSLHQSGSTPTTDAAYKVGYAINTNAQASWDGDEFNKNDSKIATLKNEAPLLNASDTASRAEWYMQSANDTGTSSLLDDTLFGDASKTPEGKVWFVDDNLTIPAGKTITYHGKGTIIVEGNLSIGLGTVIKPSDNQSRLGFIVVRDSSSPTNAKDVFAQGNNKIRASIYCKDTITVGNNSDFTGSFVAYAFDGLDSTTNNVRFYYDYNLDSSWPPGFRYLNMPHASSK